ncbi:ABC transporter ATP-binding protein [Grimontia kaedaensis]|uniref:ABC transporter ATP-binding protein n=1 Tax=Grimontia kaedaensis TaxID=2872157 RepID=A0ABY4WVF5_9GAMM|nr:ABC transporter ATP-binding protein [Grimontia kaedaensis]USH03260.1 ABC transporter ATP-binding protein [Grimontia kaedaensis]
MSEILVARNLAKHYRNYGNEIKRIISWFGIKVDYKNQEVLNGVSFSLNKGEALGVVGRNGAGKSTLLKLITGTLNPTSGNVVSHGKISAILELGMGFNIELTGRENVYHSSGLMGHSLTAIDGQIREIEAFADIGEFFDLPIRTYSSGMQARLAFAVATAFRPDILIVDEALSVGDASFQAKCYSHMKKIKEAGTAILLVSHDAQAIMNFCDRAIFLHCGEVVADGTPKETIQLYDKVVNNYQKAPNQKSDKISEEPDFEVIEFGTFDQSDIARETFFPGELIKIRAKFSCGRELKEPHLGFRIADRFGISVFETNTYCMGIKSKVVKQNALINIEFSLKLNIGYGEYTIDLALVNEGLDERSFKESLLMCHNIMKITVIEDKGCFIFSGSAFLEPKVSLEIGNVYVNN